MTGNKKTMLILGGTILVSVLIGLGLSRLMTASKEPELPSNVAVQSVETGSVSQVVTGAGALASDKKVNVLVPADLEVQRVLVHEGDVVQIGTPIARVTAASVREKRLAIEENIDSLQDQLDNLDDDSDNDLKRQVLEEQIADLKIDRDSMERLQETCILESDENGVVGTLSLWEGTRTGKVPLREQGSASDSSAQTTDQTASDATAYGTTNTAVTMVGPKASGMVLHAGLAPAPESMLQVAAEVEASSDDGAGEPDVGTAGDEGGSGNEGANSPDNGGAGANAPAPPSTESQTTGEGSASGNAQQDAPSHQSITGSIKVAITPPVTGKVPQDTVVFPEEAPYTATSVSWAPQDKQFAPQTEYVCTVYLTAKEGYGFALDRSKIDVTVPSSVATRHEALDLDNDGIAETLKVEAAFSATQPVVTDAGTASLDAMAFGDLSSDSFSDFDFGDVSTSETGSTSSLSKAGSSYSDTEAVALSITPSGKMFLDVKVSELDVLKLKEGQKAQVTIDAMPGETFEGTISKIANSADKVAQEGDAAKFTTRIELGVDDRMRYGMSAKVTVVVEEATDVLLVPLEAISQQEGKSVVFTSVDADGTLASPVVVQTGLSSESQVEVKSGLKQGDTVYYIPAKSDDPAAKA